MCRARRSQIRVARCRPVSQPSIERRRSRPRRRRMIQVCRVKRETQVSRTALNAPPHRSHGGGSVCLHWCATAPPHDGRGNPARTTRVVHEDRAVVFTVAETGCGDRPAASGSRQPRRWDEPRRVETQSREQRQAAVDPLARGAFIESQELALARGLPPRPYLVPPAARCTDLVVPFTMEQDLCARVGARSDPPHEGGGFVERPRAVPVGNQE